jgi:hypothetical protein
MTRSVPGASEPAHVASRGRNYFLDREPRRCPVRPSGNGGSRHRFHLSQPGGTDDDIRGRCFDTTGTINRIRPAPFSDELLREWEWSEHFAAQPETLRCCNLVADKLDLRRDISRSFPYRARRRIVLANARPVG